MIDNNMRVKTIGKIENINSKAGVVADIDSIRGGRLIVADKKQLSLVPVEKCKVGMVIYVQSENKEYTLIQEPTGTIYTDSADWEVKKTNAEDVYVQNGTKQTSVVEDYTTKINAAAAQTLETVAENYTPKTEFEQQMNAATTRITTVEERSSENASKIKTAEQNISKNSSDLQKLNDKVFGTKDNPGLKQDIYHDLDTVNNTVASMSTNIKTNSDDIRSLTTELKKQSDSISTNQKAIDNIVKDIGDYSIKSQFGKIDDKIAEIESNAVDKHTELKNSINENTASVKNVEKALNAFEAETGKTLVDHDARIKEAAKTADDNKTLAIDKFNQLNEKITNEYTTQKDFNTLNDTVNSTDGLVNKVKAINAQFERLYGDYNLNSSVKLSDIVSNISDNAKNIATNANAIGPVDATSGIRKDIKDLQLKDDTINDSLKAVNKKFDDYTLKSEYNNLSTTVSGLDKSLTNANRNFESFQNAVAAYETKTTSDINDIEKSVKDLDNKKLDTENFNQLTGNITSTLSTVANNANLATQTAAETSKQLSTFSTTTSNSITDLTNRLNETNTKLSDLKTSVTTNENNIKSITDIIGIGNKEIFTNTANHTICDYITDMVRTDNEIKNKLKDIDTINENYQKADTDIKASIEALKNTVKDNKDKLDAKDAKFTEDIQTIKNDITNINNATAANSDAIKTNIGNIDTLTSSVSKVDGIASKNTKSIEALQDVVNANTESIKGLKKDKDAFLDESGLSKDTATAQTLYNATLYTLKGFINTHEISDIEKRDAKKTTIIGNIVANAKAINAVKASIKTNSDNIDKNTQSISYLNETAKSLKLQPVIEDISSDKSTGEVKVKLDIENIKMTAFQYMTLGIAGRTKEDKTTSSTWVPNSSSEYFGISDSLLTDENGNTNMVTVRGYITPQNAAAEDQIYLESDPMDLTKEFSISYGFIKPETKTINGNTYHQYVELGKTKIHFFDDDGVTIKIKLPDRIADDDANVDDSVKLAIGFTNVDNREADVADSCFAFSLAGAFEATSLDGATEDGGLYIIRSNKTGDAGEIVNHGSFAITSNAIRRAGEVGFVTVFQI